MTDSVFLRANEVLLQNNVNEKLRLTGKLQQDWLAGKLEPSRDNSLECSKPGQPENLVYVAPSKLPRRTLHSVSGKIAFIHALTHIEFTAINLALDIIARFQDMPRQFYQDWIRVAAEEASHFDLLNTRLISLGSRYGDLPVHNGLWTMATKTANDVLDRLALVPRMLEARGLDVTPDMINRLLEINDHETADILKKILADEIGHVKIGSQWFSYVCKKRGLDSFTTFFELLRKNAGNQIRKPINHEARKLAGFSEQELNSLEQMTD
ncbi:MAG: ferritin-like domain-containing protein [Acidiferrobacterales bacterium]